MRLRPQWRRQPDATTTVDLDDDDGDADDCGADRRFAYTDDTDHDYIHNDADACNAYDRRGHDHDDCYDLWHGYDCGRCARHVGDYVDNGTYDRDADGDERCCWSGELVVEADVLSGVIAVVGGVPGAGEGELSRVCRVAVLK